VNSKRVPLTVIFTTYNEEHNIEKALRSVYDWADEIIVVDSFSTDNTPNIVAQYPNVSLKQREYYSPANQKNWAIPLAQHEWVLLMDADERTTSDMRSEIAEILRGQRDYHKDYSLVATSADDTGLDIDKKNLLALHSYNQSQGYDCYWIGFNHYFMGKKVRYSGWQNDKTVRLIKRDTCRYNDNRVHEEIVMDGLKVGILKNKFEHYTFKDFGHFIEKQQRYAVWSAEDKSSTTRKITYFHLILKPFARFFKHFILKRGFLDGRVGFMISAIAAWTVFLRYAFMLEKQGRLGINPNMPVNRNKETA
jgi:glycosyltransferase involved in cell wall biosynthesis